MMLIRRASCDSEIPLHKSNLNSYKGVTFFGNSSMKML